MKVIENWGYTLRELVSGWLNDGDTTKFDGKSAMLVNLGGNMEQILSTHIEPTAGPSLIWDSHSWLTFDVDNYKYSVNPDAKTLLGIVSNRFADDIALVVGKDDELIPSSLSILDEIINLVDNTYARYHDLLNYYKSVSGKLLDSLETVTETNSSRELGRIGSSSDSGSATTKRKDVPQSDLLPDDGWNSEVNHTSSETSGSSSSTDTESSSSTSTVHDPRGLLVDRLSRVQEVIRNTYLDWSNEFERLFLGRPNWRE